MNTNINNNDVIGFPNAIELDLLENFNEQNFDKKVKKYKINNHHQENEKKDNTAERMGNQKKIHIFSKKNDNKLLCTVHKEKNIQKNHDEENSSDDKKQNNNETSFHPLIANSFTRFIFGDKKAPLILDDGFESFSGLSMEYFNFNENNTNKTIQLKNDNFPDYHLKQMEVVQNILDINEIKFDCHNDKEEAKNLGRENITDYGKDNNNNKLKFYEGVENKSIQGTDYPNDILLELLLYTLLTGKMDIKNRNVCLMFDENKKPYLVHIDYDHFTYGGKKEGKGGYDVFFDKEGWEEFYSEMCFFIIDLISPTEESFNKRISKYTNWDSIKHISIPKNNEMVEEHEKKIDEIFNKIKKTIENPEYFIYDIFSNIFLTIPYTKYDTEEKRKELQELITKNIHYFFDKMFGFYDMLYNRLDDANLKTSSFVTKFRDSIQTVKNLKETFKTKVNKTLNKYFSDFIASEKIMGNTIYSYIQNNNKKRTEELIDMSNYDEDTKPYRETKKEFDKKQEHRYKKYLIKNTERHKKSSFFDKFCNLFTCSNCKCSCNNEEAELDMSKNLTKEQNREIK